MTIEERFFDKVVISASGCHLWTGMLNDWGYGYFHVNGKKVGAHRFAWQLANGAIPEGNHLHHRHECPKNCVNAEHLTPLSASEHSRLHANLTGHFGKGGPWHPALTAGSAASRRAATHCKRQHEFDEANTNIRPNGSRECLACGRLRAERTRQRHREGARP